MDLHTLAALPSWEWPDDAGDAILETLLDARAEHADRMLAAELAGDFVVATDEVVGALLAVVRDQEAASDLRARAAIGLGPTLEQVEIEGFEDPWDAYAEDETISEPVAREVRGALHKLYLDADVPAVVRRAVLEASVRHGEDWHEGAVRAAWHTDDRAWRVTAVFCMGFVRGFDQEIVEALASGLEELEFEAVRAAGQASVRGAWPHVRRILRGGRADEVLLFAAIEASQSVAPGYDDLRGELGPLIDGDDAEISEAALDALMMAEIVLSDGDDWEDDELGV